MKNKILYVTVLALASSAICAAPIMIQAQSAGSSTITIKDPAEFNAYNQAISQTTPQAKESSIEAFLAQYPDSVVKKQVLEILMDAYTQSGNTAKALTTARNVLQVDPTDLRALALSAYVLRQEAGQKTSPAEAQPLLDEAGKDGQTGLTATAPEGTDAATFNKVKAAVSPIFHGAIAADALEKKDYANAIKHFKAELEAMPEQQQTTAGVQDTYLLGTAYTQETPQDLVNAIWYLSRAAAYAPGNFKDQIQKSAEYWYKKYHH